MGADKTTDDAKPATPPSDAPSNPKPPTQATGTSSRRASVVVANPGQPVVADDAPPVPPDPLELLHRIALGLERIARSEGAKAQPSATAWAQLRREIAPILQASGFDVAPVAVAPTNSRRNPIVGANATRPGAISIPPRSRVATRVELGGSPYNARKTARRGSI